MARKATNHKRPRSPSRINAASLKENMTCKIDFYQGRAVAVQVPFTVELKVVETEPSVKGATVTNVYKPAKMETGAEFIVPAFVNIGNVIKIDTRTGEYQNRASKT